jgi:outer membrane receptor protein involved in Fe transport
VHATAGTGIRPPDAFEIAFTDNPSLKPERTRSVEGGLAQEFAGGLLRADATAFVNRYDDVIVAVRAVSPGASQYRTDNISNARARGVELAFSSRIRGGVSALLSYTFLDTEILRDDGDGGNIPAPFRPGDALIRRPRHQAAVDVTFVRHRVSAYARVGARGRVLDIDPSYGAFGGLLIAPGFVTTHAGAAFRLTPRIEMYGHISNLFDRRYEEAIGFPAPPRTATIGVRVAAGR